jgi:hypothetical protein
MPSGMYETRILRCPIHTGIVVSTRGALRQLVSRSFSIERQTETQTQQGKAEKCTEDTASVQNL